MGRGKATTGTKPRSVRIPVDMYAALHESARENERSIAKEMVYRLRQQMKSDGAKAKRS